MVFKMGIKMKWLERVPRLLYRPPEDIMKEDKMEGSCMDLALEGERLCKAGDCKAGVRFFEAAIQVGTDDLKTLSAIYSQMGNAYFYLQEYGRALEYHKHDLNLARTLGDKLGEAKASGNLGNTLKVLGKFNEATACCERHLDISRELSDKIGEARALYNLGNVYHAMGKHAGRSTHQDPGEFPPEVKASLQKAAEYYESNLHIVQELGDRAAQGRACGNLGNTHYLLGNFTQAIRYHEERLAIAKEFGDKSAERRAYSNLGNAHIFLGEFDTAAEHYRKTLQIAKELEDKALEAQACYSLGNTYTLLRDYERAIEYHIRHLQIAQELNDRVGEGRACWSLGNAHTALGNHEKALQFATRHLDISKEIGDQTGQVTAQMNLSDLKKVLGIKNIDSDSNSMSESVPTSDDVELSTRRPSRGRRNSMDNLDLLRMTPDKAKLEREAQANGGAKPKPMKARLEKSASVATDILSERVSDLSRPRSARTLGEKKKSEEQLDQDGFFELLHKFQSRRIDDQRCSFRVLERNDSLEGAAQNISASPHADEFLDMVAGIQGSRMNDQRASLPQFPGLHNSQEIIGHLLTKTDEKNALDDQFFEMLMRCQGSRIDDQRSEMPARAAPTVPDEDFFCLIQRVQSDRLDGQRSHLPVSPSDSLVLKPRTGSKKKKDKKDKENKGK